MRGEIKRGDIFRADLDPALGSEQGKERRVLIVSNNIGNSNRNCPVVIAVPITGEVTSRRKKMPMYVSIFPDSRNGQTKEALIDCFQIRVLDIDQRLKEKMGQASEMVMRKVDAALETCLQLKTCKCCNSVLLPNKNHCVKCRHILIRICENCHEKVNSEHAYCHNCGTQRGDNR